EGVAQDEELAESLEVVLRRVPLEPLLELLEALVDPVDGRPWRMRNQRHDGLSFVTSPLARTRGVGPADPAPDCKPRSTPLCRSRRPRRHRHRSAAATRGGAGVTNRQFHGIPDRGGDHSSTTSTPPVANPTTRETPAWPHPSSDPST